MREGGIRILRNSKFSKKIASVSSLKGQCHKIFDHFLLNKKLYMGSI